MNLLWSDTVLGFITPGVALLSSKEDDEFEVDAGDSGGVIGMAELAWFYIRRSRGKVACMITLVKLIRYLAYQKRCLLVTNSRAYLDRTSRHTSDLSSVAHLSTVAKSQNEWAYCISWNFRASFIFT